MQSFSFPTNSIPTNKLKVAPQHLKAFLLRNKFPQKQCDQKEKQQQIKQFTDIFQNVVEMSDSTVTDCSTKVSYTFKKPEPQYRMMLPPHKTYLNDLYEIIASGEQPNRNRIHSIQPLKESISVKRTLPQTKSPRRSPRRSPISKNQKQNDYTPEPQMNKIRNFFSMDSSQYRTFNVTSKEVAVQKIKVKGTSMDNYLVSQDNQNQQTRQMNEMDQRLHNLEISSLIAKDINIQVEGVGIMDGQYQKLPRFGNSQRRGRIPHLPLPRLSKQIQLQISKYWGIEKHYEDTDDVTQTATQLKITPSFIQDDHDRFGQQLFPVAQRLPIPGPGEYNNDLDSIGVRQIKLNEKVNQQKLIVEWQQKYNSEHQQF